MLNYQSRLFNGRGHIYYRFTASRKQSTGTSLGISRKILIYELNVFKSECCSFTYVAAKYVVYQNMYILLFFPNHVALYSVVKPAERPAFGS